MRKRRGIALVMVMLALSLLAVTTLGITYLGNMSLMQSKNQYQTDEALFAAQAGLRVKIGQIRDGDETNITGNLANSEAKYAVTVYPAGTEVWPGFTVPSDDGHFYILAEGTSRAGKNRRVGMLVRKSASDYNIAALASHKITLKDRSYTQTYSSDPTKPVTPADYTLATVGVTKASGKIEIDDDPGKESYVGFDNLGSGKARLYAPPGSVETSVVTKGLAGTNFSNFTIESTLSPLKKFKGREFSSKLGDDAVADTGDVLTLTPTHDPGPDGTMGTSDDEWVVKRKKIEAKNGGIILLDISGVPDDQTARFNFESMEMSTGGIVQMVSGTSQANCQFYVDSDVTILGGSIINPTAVPSRFEFLIKKGDVTIQDLGSVGYMVVKAPDSTIAINGGELRGAVVAKDVKLDKAARLFYDKMLSSANTGASVVVQLSYQQF